jgi:DHA1 family bicyclomycin/chloramphenicol resistance-like MFS transporter
MVIGFIAGTFLAQSVVGRPGIDGTIGLGVTALALGGGLMLVLVALGVPSSFATTGPMALLQSAWAHGPFLHRAGAASSLLGLCQMTFAAILGIGPGLHLDMPSSRCHSRLLVREPPEAHPRPDAVAHENAGSRW